MIIFSHKGFFPAYICLETYLKKAKNYYAEKNISNHY